MPKKALKEMGSLKSIKLEEIKCMTVANAEIIKISTIIILKG
ncbi:hypothetical protein C723_3382 [Christiangramia flava JLT2011]|uniref:Uncharacterized protein n=1 Tax=Christiangramia flava JLT2011 TaxID=1229726 RepID=A0A1L7I750_9FLAO|nr:hypothetical protein GRFL_2703 [Christiangramia flava JLT2011]OSS37749.1 hypothetical protein C723_3382 [Christiangramia flava JLT2011]